MRFHLLGGLAVFDGEHAIDLSARKQRALLAVLLLERDRVVSVDRLIDTLWDDEGDKALASLQVYVSRLRSVLEPGRQPREPATVLLSQPPGYRLAVAREQVDLHRFEDHVARGREQLRRGDPSSAAAVFDAALQLWTGDLLPEFAGEPFALAAAERAVNTRVSAVEGAAEARLELGDHDGAIERLAAEAIAQPTSERMHGLLALALYRGERQTDALRAVDRCRKALIDSAGLDLGPDLKQLEQRLLTHDATLRWQPKASPPTAAPNDSAFASPSVAESAPNRQASGVQLFGRARERAALERAVTDAAGGIGGVAVLIGEPGIGKTSLAESTVEFAKGLGIATAWCRCPESRITPPFWAVTELGDQLRGAGVGHQRTSDPGYRSRLRDVLDSGGEHISRFDLHRSVLTSLSGLERSIVLVIDDLQWADADTLRVIEHLVSGIGSTHALLVMTTRPLAEGSPAGLVDCLAEVTRAAHGVTLRLAALHSEDVIEWLAARGGSALPDEVGELVHDRTGGNPLFIRELTELLASEGRLGDPAAVRSGRAIPPGVQFVVRRRVSRLPVTSQKLLSVAAVVGKTFDAETLAVAAGTDLAELLDGLEPALDAGLLLPAGGDFAFSHALVADALADEVNVVRKASIHAAAARSIAARSGPGFGAQVSAVAHHALEGILAGTGELAVEASRQAASRATSRSAHEDAAAHWANVASALARSRPSDVEGQVDALVEQAQSFRRVAMVTAAKASILAAIELAEATGMTGAAVRAAALLNNVYILNDNQYGVVDEHAVNVITRTLRTVDDNDVVARAELLGGLAIELMWAERDRHELACRDSEEAARTSGDALLLATALVNNTMPNRPSPIEHRQRQLNQAIELCTSHGLPGDLLIRARQFLTESHMETADFDRASDELRLAQAAFDATSTSRVLSTHHWLNAAIAVATARYDDADLQIDRAVEHHRRGQLNDANFMLAAARSAIRIDRGGAEQVVHIAEAVARRTVDDRSQRGAAVGQYGRSVVEAMAFTMLEIGRRDIAEALAESVVPASGFRDDFTLLCAATAALHVRVEIDDLASADSLAALLMPYRDRWATYGAAAMSMGPICLALARYEAATDRHASAESNFASAVAMCDRNGAAAWLARGLVHQAAFHFRSGDRTRGLTELSRANGLAERHQLPYVRRRIEALR